MNVKSVTDARKFAPDKPAKTALFGSDRMACDVVGMAPGQQQRPHVHEECDKLYTVIEGCGNFNVNGELREVGEKNVVYVQAGVEHSVKNDGGANLTLLVVLSPSPRASE